MKTYTIQGHSFSQDIMKLRQDKALIMLWADKDVKVQEIFKVDGVLAALKFLAQNDILDDFLRIILIGDTSKIDFDKLSNEILIEILNDFFFFNKQWLADGVSLLRRLIFSAQPSTKAGLWQNLKSSVATKMKSKK